MYDPANIHRINAKSYLNHKNGWYSNKEFSLLLKENLRHSEICHAPLSYITIDLSNGYDSASEDDIQPILTQLIIILTKQTRQYDIKHLPCRSKIGLLLMNTCNEDNDFCIERLYKQFEKHFKQINISDLHRFIKISGYQLYPRKDNFKIDERSGITMGINPNQEQLFNDSYMIRRERSFRVADWDINLSNSGSLAVSRTSLSIKNLMDFSSIVSYAKIKRLFDFAGAILFIFLFSPMMIMIAVAIKLTSKGPVLFKQERYGHLGKPFIFLKFRTMHIDSDSSIHENYVKKLINGQNGEINNGTEDKPFYKMSDDPRVTKIGGFLRATSLDELPQFINVFKGDMSLIGPRPPIQYEVNEYKGWQYRRILEAKPGITGLWQVSGRNSTTFDEMVKLDIEYAQNVSFLLDLKILFKTIKAVLFTKGC